MYIYIYVHIQTIYIFSQVLSVSMSVSLSTSVLFYHAKQMYAEDTISESTSALEMLKQTHVESTKLLYTQVAVQDVQFFYLRHFEPSLQSPHVK